MLTWDAFIPDITSSIAGFLKKRYDERQKGKDIINIVHKAFNDHSQILLPLCMDKTFCDLLFCLAKGQSINAQKLVKLAQSISESKKLGLSFIEIVEELHIFALKLNNIIEEISPEVGKQPSAFLRFFHSLDHMDTSSQQFAKSQPINRTYFIIPFPRNSLLRHEESWITQIHESLFDGAKRGNAIISAISGQGGVGKTAMAIEYAYRYVNEYPGGVFWIEMSQGIEIAARRFFETAYYHGLQTEIRQNWPENLIIQKLITFLNSLPLKLVILDNLEADTLPKEIPFKDAKILITTRRRSLPVPLIEMGLPNREESQDIFLAYANKKLLNLTNEEKEIVGKICDRVGFLPLALEILGQIARRRILLNLEISLDQEIVQMQAPTNTKEQTSIMASLRLAEQEYKHPLATTCLIASGYLHLEEIEPNIISKALKMDFEITEKMLESLADFSVIGVGERYYNIHQLTQEVARLMDANQAIGNKIANYINKKIIAALKQGHLINEYKLIPHIISIASIARSDLHKEIFPSCSLLLPWTRFLSNCCAYYHAEFFERSCVSRIAKSKGENSTEYGTRLNNLASVLRAKGKFKEAEQLFKKAIEISKRNKETKTPEYCLRLGNLAVTLYDQGDYNESEKIYYEVLEISKNIFGMHSADYAMQMSNMALTLKSAGKYKKALQLSRKAADIGNKILGEKHPTSATFLNNMAIVEKAIGKYEKAEKHFRKVLQIEKSTIGEEHADYATSLDNLAIVLSYQNKKHEAEQLLRQALKIGKKTIGERHPEYAARLNNLAGTLCDIGKYHEAEQLYQEALNISCQALGTEHKQCRQIAQNFSALIKLSLSHIPFR